MSWSSAPTDRDPVLTKRFRLRHVDFWVPVSSSSDCRRSKSCWHFIFFHCRHCCSDVVNSDSIKSTIDTCTGEWNEIPISNFLCASPNCSSREARKSYMRQQLSFLLGDKRLIHRYVLRKDTPTWSDDSLLRAGRSTRKKKSP